MKQHDSAPDRGLEFLGLRVHRTVFGKAEIVLWRPAEQVFRIEVWRSFATYVVDLLREIDRESVA